MLLLKELQSMMMDALIRMINLMQCTLKYISQRKYIEFWFNKMYKRLISTIIKNLLDLKMKKEKWIGATASFSCVQCKPLQYTVHVQHSH